MFGHPNFHRHNLSEVPLNRDLFLVDAKHMGEYEREWLSLYDGKEYEPTYWVSYVAVRARFTEALELSWYPNINTRFHELKVILPAEAFICCIGQVRHDGNPVIFVRSEWLEELYLRKNSIFALVDAIGIKSVIRSAKLSRSDWIAVRARIDEIASHYPNVAFVSVADSVLLKSHWRPANVDLKQSYDYEPEVILDAIAEVDRAFREALALGTYAVLVQGANEYYDDSLLHISASQNHISLNSIGLPLAQLYEIDSAARRAIKGGQHAPFDLYIDSTFLHSLDLEHGFDREALVTGTYESKMASGPARYYAVSLAKIQQSRRRLNSVSARAGEPGPR
jgi:hypothetical protein